MTNSTESTSTTATASTTSSELLHIVPCMARHLSNRAATNAGKLEDLQSQVMDYKLDEDTAIALEEHFELAVHATKAISDLLAKIGDRDNAKNIRSSKKSETEERRAHEANVRKDARAKREAERAVEKKLTSIEKDKEKEEKKTAKKSIVATGNEHVSEETKTVPSDSVPESSENDDSEVVAAAS